MGYSASSSATSGVKANNSFDHSGFSVNFGTQQVLPTWVLGAGLVIAALWLMHRRP